MGGRLDLAHGSVHLEDVSASWGKAKSELSKKDILALIDKREIQFLNLRFVAGDGRLKSFGFTTADRRHLDRVLSTGERVDGSSLFSSIDAGSSDLYVVPRYRTAYLNPFTPIPTLDLLCSFFTDQGAPLPNDPGYLCRKAQNSLFRATGYHMEALGELEYYAVGPAGEAYTPTAQRGYGESSPFARYESLRQITMVILGNMGYSIKYGHNEVGQFIHGSKEWVQQEIEFNLAPLEESAEALVMARWVLRMVAQRMGSFVTFSPKVLAGHAGSGMHVHTRLVKDGRSAVEDDVGLTEVAHRLVAGFLDLAPALTAFGNPIPLSYLRLVPNHEAPVYVCWGSRNRSALVRIPLGWRNVGDMAALANPNDPEAHTPSVHNQTIEFRSPDGAADAYLLHAGLAVAARHGLEMQSALALSERLHVHSNIFKDPDTSVRDRLPKLPSGCAQSARCLLDQRSVFEKDGVFTAGTLDAVAARLSAFEEEDDRLRAGDEQAIHEAIGKYLHCA
jgi:glutamine synthetase